MAHPTWTVKLIITKLQVSEPLKSFWFTKPQGLFSQETKLRVRDHCHLDSTLLSLGVSLHGHFRSDNNQNYNNPSTFFNSYFTHSAVVLTMMSLHPTPHLAIHLIAVSYGHLWRLSVQSDVRSTAFQVLCQSAVHSQIELICLGFKSLSRLNFFQMFKPL